jgi:hypothetical protein
MSAAVGLLASAGAAVAYLAVSPESSLWHVLDKVYMTPGYAFSAPFGYSACPLFRHLFGWSGPGGAFMQMLLVAFISWAIVLGAASYVVSALRAKSET